MPVSIKDNISSYFTSAIPGVFLDRITLTPAGRTKIKVYGNPHIRQNELGKTYGTTETGPPANGQDQASAPSLSIQVDLSLKAAVPRSKNIKNSWFFNKSVAEHYRILFFYNTSSEIFDKINSSENIAQTIMEIAQNSSDNNIKPETLSMSDTGLLTITDSMDVMNYIQQFNKVVTPDGSTVYDVPFSRNFIIENVNPDHLSIIAVPFLDIEEASGLAEMKKHIPEDLFYGQPIVELVTNNGTTASNRRALYEVDPTTLVKKMWHGPVHQMPDGTWMTGETHQPGDRTLIEEQVDNSLIQDFRSTGTMEKQLFDFNTNENPTLGRDSLKILNNDNLDIDRKVTYFSNFFNSRDASGKCRFFFSLDKLTMAKKNSTFPKLYQTGDSSLLAALINNTLIKELRIFRKEVIGGGCLGNEYISVKDLDPNEVPTPIAELNQIKANGVVREINLFSSNLREQPPYMTHYTGFDSSINKLGQYKYSVEVDFTDGTVTFVKNNLRLLQDMYQGFKQYEDLSNNISLNSSNVNRGLKIRYFNSISNRFIPEFIQEVSQHEESLVRFMADATTRKRMIKDFLDIYDLFTLNQTVNTQKEDRLKNFSVMTDPEHGTPEGINYLVRVMLNLINQIKSALGAVSTGPTQKPRASSTSDQTPSRDRAYRPKVITITKEFSQIEELFNAKIPNLCGTHYISFSNQDQEVKNGLSSLSTNDYRQRVSNETLKLLKEDANFVKISSGESADLSGTKFSFLAPHRISFARAQFLDLLELATTPQFYKTSHYDSAMAKILLFNQCENISSIGSLEVSSKASHQEKYSVEKQELRNVFIDYFSKKNCTVDSMEAFQVRETKDVSNPLTARGKDSQQNYSQEYLDRTQAEQRRRFDTTNPNVVFSRLLRQDVTPEGITFKPRQTYNVQLRPGLLNYFKDNSGDEHHSKILTSLYTFVANPPPPGQAQAGPPPAPISAGGDILRLKYDNIDHANASFMYFNFFNTVKIQYFVGYSEGPNNEAQMKSPLWVQLGSSDFARISAQNSNVLCRFRKTSNTPFSQDLLDFPMYNEYFFIDNTSTSLQRKYNFDNQNMLESPESSNQPRLEAQPAETVPEAARLQGAAATVKRDQRVVRAYHAIKGMKKSLADIPEDLEGS